MGKQTIALPLSHRLERDEEKSEVVRPELLLGFVPNTGTVYFVY
jgi:hypothetical protein